LTLRAAAVVVLALGLTVSACGTRRSHDELLTAQAGAARSAEQSGSIDNGGEVGASVDVATGTQATGTTAAGGGTPSGAGTGSIGAPGAGTGTAGTGAAGTETKTCTGKEAPVTLGSVGSQSGLIGSVIGTSVPAVQAWVKTVNAAGGLNCHQVRYLVADDGSDPAKHQALVRQMVEQQGVVAMVQMNAVLSGDGTSAYLNQKGIPVVGSEGGSNWFYRYPNFFPVTSSGDPTVESTFAAASEVAKSDGLAKVGTVSCIESAICSSVPAVADRLAQKYGVQVVSKGQASLAQPDFTSICQSAKSAGAQLLIVYMDGNSIQRLGRSCTSVGFKVPIVANGLGVVAQLLADPNLDGVYGATITIPWTETGNTEVAAARKAVSQYAPGYALGPNLMQGWTAARYFELATKNLTDFSSASILDALAKVPSTDLGGITNQLHFGPGKTSPKDFCAWLVQIKNKAFVSPSPEPTKCGVA
jgi:branched-chain amino acid transport system substrate-binding protein